MTHLHCDARITGKNLRENAAFERELIVLSGVMTISLPVIDGKPMKESEEINHYLVREVT